MSQKHIKLSLICIGVGYELQLYETNEGSAPSSVVTPDVCMFHVTVIELGDSKTNNARVVRLRVVSSRGCGYTLSRAHLNNPANGAKPISFVFSLTSLVD